MEFSGRLAAFPPGNLLQWAANDRRSGALVVRRRAREKRIYLHEGSVVACSSDDSAEFYGRHLLLGGYLDEAGLVEALTHCQRNELMLGESLATLGLLSPETIDATLAEYVADAVCDLFLWPHGVFYLEEEGPPPRQTLAHPLDAMALALQGTRWVDEYERIRRVFVHDEIVLRRSTEEDGELDEDDLSPLAQQILAAVDGHRNLTRLFRAIGGSYYRFLQAALALAVDGWLDIEEVEEEVVAPPTMEITLRDLLDEEATKEAGPATPWTLSLRALGWMVPVWVGGKPDLDDTGGLRYRICQRSDGERRLDDVLGADDEGMREAFVQAILSGCVALLPRSVQELEAEATLTRMPNAERWWRRLLRQDAAATASRKPEAVSG